MPARVGSEAFDDRLRDPLELRRLVAELIEAHASEHARIASDIHDRVIQSMTATSLSLAQLKHHVDDPKELEILGRLDKSVRASIEELRALMTSLQVGPRTPLEVTVLEALDGPVTHPK